MASQPARSDVPNATSQPEEIEFHPDAVKRFQEQATEVLNSVRSFGPSEPMRVVASPLHPVANLTTEDVRGEIQVRESSFNGLGVEVGRYWDSKGLRVGWEGAAFDSVRELARRFEVSHPLKGKVSHDFLLEEVFTWLRNTLEQKCNEELPAYIASRSKREIKQYELWVPLFRTYSQADFTIGKVRFKTISPAMMEHFYKGVPEEAARRDDVKLSINRQRSRIQGSIAASVRVTAEIQKAKELVQNASDEAIALLRFLSPVNWTCKLVSHCLPVGRPRNAPVR